MHSAQPIYYNIAAPSTHAWYWDRFVTTFKERWIYYPTAAAEAADNLKVYSRLGFPGAIGSIDRTHVMWGRCPALYQNTYTGKEKKATVAYEVHCYEHIQL